MRTPFNYSSLQKSHSPIPSLKITTMLLNHHLHLFLLLLLLPLPTLSPSSNSTTTRCPYDLDTATHLIPADCYANSTATTLASTTSCCWYVFAAYLYAAIRYSNLTGAAFLPSSSAAACSSSFSSLLLHRRLVPLRLLLNSTSCNLAGDPLRLAAGSRPCQFSSVSTIKSSIDFSSPIRICTPLSKNLDQSPDCIPCQHAVVDATFALFDVTGSKEFVPCGMAATMGVWSGDPPSIPRFRSYALCLLQVLENVGDLSTNNLIPARKDREDHPSRSRSIKISVASAVAALISVAAIIFLTRAIKKRRGRSRGGATLDLDEYLDPSSPLPTEGLYIFTRSELKHATDNYSDRLVLGEGGAGRVYLGTLPSGQHVAIKRIHEKKKVGEFYREVEILARIRHRNLATLVGYCISKKEHVLVYEYVEEGNLARALYHGDLTWRRRVRIATDVAEGIVYLHELPGGAVVHRDVKPTNVLLTGEDQAKLSDFGVSRVMPLEGSHVSTELRGTLGYVDPESFSAGHVSESADVYSFGVVLLELVTGMKAVVPTPTGGAESIVQVVREALAGDDWISTVDPKLGSEWDEASVRQVFDLGCKCVRPYKNDRPSMAEVLKVLKEVLSYLEEPILGDDVNGNPKMANEGKNYQPEMGLSYSSSSSSWSPIPSIHQQARALSIINTI